MPVVLVALHTSPAHSILAGGAHHLVTAPLLFFHYATVGTRLRSHDHDEIVTDSLIGWQFIS